MRATEIFTPGKTPTVTLVKEQIETRKQDFQDALEQNLLVAISGPSKSGKTVFVRSLVGADNLIGITGAGVQSPEQLWLKVFHAVGTPIPSSNTNEENNTFSGGATLKGEIGIVVAKKELGGNFSATTGTKKTETAIAAIDYLQLLIKELAGSGFVIFIDDFHYIPRDVQTLVAEQVKEAIGNGVHIVCASVPYHSEDILRANPDLQGRFFAIDFDYWDTDSLSRIARLGFDELNLQIDDALITAMTQEAAGSPQLMQSICLNTCFELGAREKQAKILKASFDPDLIKRICNRASSSDFSSTLERIAEGPKIRGTERKAYRLSDGETGDVYAIVLRAIASDPPCLRFLYKDLLARIKTVVEDGDANAPSGSSTSGACFHIANLANDGQAKVIIEWDQENEILDIRDPYLLFYMRWSDTVRKLN